MAKRKTKLKIGSTVIIYNGFVLPPAEAEIVKQVDIDHYQIIYKKSGTVSIVHRTRIRV